MSTSKNRNASKAKKGKKGASKRAESHKKTEIKEPSEIRGFGKFEFVNKIIYIGAYKQMKNGVKLRDGFGTVYHPSKEKSEMKSEFYEGEWKNDMMNGYGIYHYANGDIYEGNWKNNMQDGQGRYTFTDGNFYEGDWVKHQMHGTGKYLDMDNLGFEGEFREGCFFSKEQPKLKEEKRLLKIINKMKQIPFQFFKTWEDACTKIDTKTVNDILSQFFAKTENMGSYFQNIVFPLYEDYKPEYWNDALRWIFVQPVKHLIIPAPKVAVKSKSKGKGSIKAKSKEKVDEKKADEEHKDEKKANEDKKDENNIAVIDANSSNNIASLIPNVDAENQNENGPILEINVPKNNADLIILPKDSLLAPQIQDEFDSGQVIEIKTISKGEDREMHLVIGYNAGLNKWLIIYFFDNKAPEKEKKAKKKGAKTTKKKKK